MPAYWFFWLMLENVKLSSTKHRTEADTPSGIVLSLWSWACTLNVPAALNVSVNVPTPAVSCEAPGSVALASEERMATECVTVVTVFHWSSHARTVAEKGNPAVWARGVPVFPDEVPGAADSPGRSTWSRV